MSGAGEELRTQIASGSPTGVASASSATKAPTQPTGILRLRGLPFAAGEPDIREFMKSFNIQSVFICKRNGRSTGEAFVQLESPSDTAEALNLLNRQHMGHRYIEVFEAIEADLSTAKSLSMDRLKGYVIRMRGLPYTASATDVLKFFNGIDIVRGIEGVIFTYSPNGRPTGEAFVELQSEEGQREAMKKHKELMGNRYIELFTSSKADLIQAIQQNRLILGYANRKRNWLIQSGLQPTGPYSHGAAHQLVNTAPVQYINQTMEVTDMFSNMSMASQGMQMVDNRSSGPGYRPGMIDTRQQGKPRPTGPRSVQQMGPRSLPLVRGVAQQGFRPPQTSAMHGYSIPLSQAGSGHVLVQQPYIIQQQHTQGMQYDAGPTGYTQMSTLAQDQYFNQAGHVSGPGGQYVNVATTPTYTLAIQVPSTVANMPEFQQLGNSIDVSQVGGAFELGNNGEMVLQGKPGGSGTVVLQQ